MNIRVGTCASVSPLSGTVPDCILAEKVTVGGAKCIYGARSRAIIRSRERVGREPRTMTWVVGQDHSDAAWRKMRGTSHSRFKVVLFPLSLWPNNSTLTSCLTLFSFFSARIISSMLSLTRFASSSATSRLSRSTGVSFWGGRSAAASGSDSDLRRLPARVVGSVFCLRIEDQCRGESKKKASVKEERTRNIYNTAPQAWRRKENRDHACVFSPKKILYNYPIRGTTRATARPGLPSRHSKFNYVGMRQDTLTSVAALISMPHDQPRTAIHRRLQYL